MKIKNYQTFSPDDGANPSVPNAAPPAADPPISPPSNEAWSAALPDNIKAWQEVQTSKDADSFWGQMTDMKGRLGNSIRIPGDEASQEDRNKFHGKLLERVPGIMPAPDYDNPDQLEAYYKAVGRPEDGAGYTPPTNAAGEPLTSDTVDAFRSMAHKAGLNQRQYASVINDFETLSQQYGDEKAADHKEGMTALHGEWGLAYDQKIAGALRVAEATNAPEMVIESIKDKSVGAQTLRWLDGLASSFGGTGNPVGDQQGSNTAGMKTPGEALQEVAEIESNPALWDKMHPDHKRLVMKRVDLMKMATAAQQ